jgi:hypothetical protein
MGVLKMNKHQSVTKVAVSLKRWANKSIWEKDGKFFIVGDYGYGNKTEHKGKVYSEVVSTGENSWCVGTSKEEKKVEQPIGGYTAPEAPQNDEKVEEEVKAPEVTENATEVAPEVEEVVEEETKPVKEEYTQLQLDKLSTEQLMEIAKRQEDPADDIIDAMTAEELELYRQNNLETIANAEEVIANSKSDAVIDAQVSLIDKATDNIDYIKERLSSIRVELAKNSGNTSSTTGELIPEGDELVFYGVSELATFVGQDKRLISKHNKLNKIEKPVGRVGVRPIWTHEQALRIKEQYEAKAWEEIKSKSK